MENKELNLQEKIPQTEYKKPNVFKRMWNFFFNMCRSNFLFALGAIIFTLWIIICFISPYIVPYDPLQQDMAIRFSAPSAAHWFGTDNLGRDIFSRVLAGSRISISAGVLTIILSATVGTIYGGISGFVGGVVDDVLMRLAELVISFPAIILAMTISVALGPSLYNTLLAIVIVTWPSYARVMRSMVITLRENEYVEAAKSLGASSARILFKEILPNSIGPILVLSTLDLGKNILTFATLSFLGLGSPPPTPEWGRMVSDGVKDFAYWWVSTFPGLAILTVALAANFMGDGVRDYMDPKLRKEI